MRLVAYDGSAAVIWPQAVTAKVLEWTMAAVAAHEDEREGGNEDDGQGSNEGRRAGGAGDHRIGDRTG